MIKKYNNNKARTRYITNESIIGDEFRVIDEMGLQLGLLTKEEALKQAQEKEMDLVLIAPGIKPPVVKMIDIHKFQYQEEKKNREAGKGKKNQTKDVQFSLFISQNDLDRQKNKAAEFIDDGHQVRLRLALRGRELGKRDMAMQLMMKFIESLKDKAEVASEPKFQGKVLLAVLVRKK